MGYKIHQTLEITAFEALFPFWDLGFFSWNLGSFCGQCPKNEIFYTKMSLKNVIA